MDGAGGLQLGRMSPGRWGVLLVVGGVLAATLTGVAAGQGATAAPSPATQPWLDASRPVDARVSALMSAMTLAEKVGQMDQQEVTQITDQTDACTSQAASTCPTRPACSRSWSPTTPARSWPAAPTTRPTTPARAGGTPGRLGGEYNAIQHYAIDHSRLHIPVIFGVDAVHGFGHPYRGAAVPALDRHGRDLGSRAGRGRRPVTANATAATGWNWDFAPVQDLYRDHRWGRNYETWAEEPALAGRWVPPSSRPAGATRADGLNAAATVKHFAGYSQSVNGHDRVEAQLPIRYLQDVLLPSYAGAIDAGATTVMVDSGSINGIPATASHFLLTDDLREQLGFDGVVISDFGDVPALATNYHIAADFPGAIAKAVNAGVDVSMTPSDYAGWQAALLQDVRQGPVSERGSTSRYGGSCG